MLSFLAQSDSFDNIVVLFSLYQLSKCLYAIVELVPEANFPQPDQMARQIIVPAIVVVVVLIKAQVRQA